LSGSSGSSRYFDGPELTRHLVACSLSRSALVRWTSLMGVTTAICRTLDSTVLKIHWCDQDLGGTRQYGRLLTTLPTRSIPPPLSLGYSCHGGARQASALLTSRPNLVDAFIKSPPPRGLQTSSCTRTHREAESASSDRLCVQRTCRLY